VAPWGTVKLKTAAELVPEFVTKALVPAAPVVVDPTEIVAAAPLVPFEPLLPLFPAGPAIPCGIAKLRTAAEVVPVFVTEAEDPAAPVVVEPTVMVAAEPAVPLLPAGPGAPWGIVKAKTAAELVPVFITLALVPAAPVVVEPTDMVAALPAAPVLPLLPLLPACP
jgi:hypothetical protein